LRPHLTHLFMDAGDLARTKWFWVEAIGLELLEDHGPYVRVGGNGGFAIGIEQAPPSGVSGAGPEITVRVPDVDALAERLRTLGVEIVEGPLDQPWGARHCWILDPDGRRMSLYSSPESMM
jgi:catechol 2,3-dioxygenase-like lactoylglutathione lyase family enzyme